MSRKTVLVTPNNCPNHIVFVRGSNYFTDALSDPRRVNCAIMRRRRRKNYRHFLSRILKDFSRSGEDLYSYHDLSFYHPARDFRDEINKLGLPPHAIWSFLERVVCDYAHDHDKKKRCWFRLSIGDDSVPENAQHLHKDYSDRGYRRTTHTVVVPIFGKTLKFVNSADIVDSSELTDIRIRHSAPYYIVRHFDIVKFSGDRKFGLVHGAQGGSRIVLVVSDFS